MPGRGPRETREPGAPIGPRGLGGGRRLRSAGVAVEANCAHAKSAGPFTVDGYGALPFSCSNTDTASCEIKLCDQTEVVVKAQTADRWVFEVEIDGVAAAWSREDGVARTTGCDNTWQETLRDAPSGWTCSSSALRFRVDTAGPESSLTMVPRSPASGFVVTRRV